MGHEVVHHAASLEDALVAANCMPLDMAILDINVQGAVSYPIAEILQTRGIPFIFTSGYAKDWTAEKFAARPLLLKPYTDDDLRGAMTRALA